GEYQARVVVIDVSDDIVEKGLGYDAAHGKSSRIEVSRPATCATTVARLLGASRPRGDLTKSCQRAEDNFMPHHEDAAKTARAGPPPASIAENDAAIAPRSAASSIGTRSRSRRRSSRSFGRQLSMPRCHRACIFCPTIVSGRHIHTRAVSPHSKGISP